MRRTPSDEAAQLLQITTLLLTEIEARGYTPDLTREVRELKQRIAMWRPEMRTS